MDALPRPARLSGVCAATLAAGLVVPRLRRPLRRAGRDSQPATSRRRAHRRRAPLLRARAVPRLPAARQPAGASRAGRTKRVRAPGRIEAIPGDARIVEIGCGTGQMCLYLARADRVVIGADLTRASLLLGAAAARRFGLDAGAIRGDRSAAARFEGGLVRRRLFVGRPAPHAGPARVVRPAGAARAAGRDHRARRLQRVRARPAAASASRRAAVGLSRASRSIRCCAIAPASRRGGRRGCAISISIPKSTATRSPRCRAGLPRIDVEYLRAYPSAVLGEEPEELFARAADNWRPEGWLAQLGWMRALGHEGGLFFTVGRRT